MAWQMASVDANIFKLILEKCEANEMLTKKDHRVIWRRLFLQGLFKRKLEKKHYWVVDGLDECLADSELVPLLLKIGESSSIRICITCRSNITVYKQISQPKIIVVSHTLSSRDTRKDIELYIRANTKLLPLVSEEARNIVVKQILSKSAGCFL